MSVNPTQALRLPIRAVASLTGLLPVTLRAWERRYGLIRPSRSPSGHRLYTQEQVDLIHRIVALTGQGIPIGQVRDALAGSAPETAAGRAGPWSRYLERMSRAIGNFDERMLDEVYDETLSLHPIERVTRNLLMPLLAELGRRWDRTPGGIAEEHFFAVYLRNKLGARLHHRRLTSGPRLLLACAPGEHHEIGLLLFALAVNDAGMRCVPLGADMPLGELAAAALRSGCVAIVISSSVDPQPAALREELPSLVAQARVPVFFGGQASVRHHDAIVAAGAVPLGADIEAGVRRLAEILPAAKRTR
ncbi:MAG: MerR family transcriptional regulator [Candidatus Parcubacteria bacterium]|nr:MerR family transcriptional regulator [Burkholderiales bacterium]